MSLTFTQQRKKQLELINKIEEMKKELSLIQDKKYSKILSISENRKIGIQAMFIQYAPEQEEKFCMELLSLNYKDEITQQFFLDLSQLIELKNFLNTLEELNQ